MDQPAPQSKPAYVTVQTEKEERRAALKEIMLGMGPGAKQREVYDAFRVKGIQTPGAEAYYALRRELWPDLQSRRGVQGGRPAKRREPVAEAEKATPIQRPTQVPEPSAAESPVTHLEAIARAAKWCGGWAQLRRLIDAMETCSRIGDHERQGRLLASLLGIRIMPMFVSHTS